MLPNSFLKTVVSTFVVVLVGATLCPAQILNYEFDGNTNNGGTGGSSYNLTMAGSTPVSYGVGVGGSGQAINMTANPVGGAATTFGSASINLPSQGAMTLAGWINVDEVFTTTASTILRNSASNNGFLLGTMSSGASVGALTLTVGTGSANMRVTSDYNTFGTSSQIGQWIFFAISFNFSDGSYAWYRGTETSSVQTVGTGTTSPASFTMVASSSGSTILGRSNSGQGSYSGYLDDLELYGSALNFSQIEALRVSAIPEPGAVGLVGVGAFLVLCFRRRRH